MFTRLNLKLSMLSMFLVLVVCRVDARQNSGYQYLYLERQEDHLELKGINPSGLIRNVMSITSPIPYTISTSPNGIWVATAAPLSDQSGMVTLTHLSLNMQQDFQLNVGGTSQAILSWSPDSQQLLAVADGIFAHNVETSTTRHLKNTGGVYTGLVQWSPDSTQFVATQSLVRQSADGGIDYSYLFEVVDAESLSQIHSILLGPTPPLYPPVCQPGWSPDNRYISFRTGCDSTLYIPREVFLWDLQNGNLRQITTFSNPDTLAIPGYTLLWYDTSTLMISAITLKGIDQSTVEKQTSLYNPMNDTTSILSTQHAFSLLLKNPVSEQIAFQETGIEANTGEIKLEPQHTGIISSFATFDLQIDQSSQRQAIATAGCNYQWSPDGEWLAFTVHPENNCAANVEKIVFVSARSSEIFEYPVAADASTSGIGWVVATN